MGTPAWTCCRSHPRNGSLPRMGPRSSICHHLRRNQEASEGLARISGASPGCLAEGDAEVVKDFSRILADQHGLKFAAKRAELLGSPLPFLGRLPSMVHFRRWLKLLVFAIPA